VISPARLIDSIDFKTAVWQRQRSPVPVHQLPSRADTVANGIVHSWRRGRLRPLRCGRGPAGGRGVRPVRTPRGRCTLDTADRRHSATPSRRCWSGRAGAVARVLLQRRGVQIDNLGEKHAGEVREAGWWIAADSRRGISRRVHRRDRAALPGAASRGCVSDDLDALRRFAVQELRKDRIATCRRSVCLRYLHLESSLYSDGRVEKTGARARPSGKTSRRMRAVPLYHRVRRRPGPRDAQSAEKG